ncbi:hypothetical protein UPYG_G00050160 [Umbra pygmaea]|uniref:Uncharacterized protein n=1 Tax=Umbra pygmaea TaxID=75934 RepID=A0ABD0XRP4_UMBPY
MDGKIGPVPPVSTRRPLGFHGGKRITNRKFQTDTSCGRSSAGSSICGTAGNIQYKSTGSDRTCVYEEAAKTAEHSSVFHP